LLGCIVRSVPSRLRIDNDKRIFENISHGHSYSSPTRLTDVRKM
jgi:hypothetical protein